MASDAMVSMIASEEVVQSKRHTSKEKKVMRKRRWLQPGHLFVLPYVIMLLLFGITPTLFAIIISFFQGNLAGLNFSGLENFSVFFSG